MKGSIAVLNAGSSSIKFALYDAEPSEGLLFRGQIEQIGVAPHLHVADADGETIAEKNWASLDHRQATREIIEMARGLVNGRSVEGYGHRVVHGGMKFAAPVRVDRTVLAELEKLTPLAPLHQPHNLAPIAAIADVAPHVPQVACFDTAFHRSQPRLAQLFGLPRKLSDAGIRRYGFHGLSYEFVSGRLRELAPALADKRIVIAHLGNGASLCALRNGRSVATTMGFTALDGLLMGTRSGAIDPGILLYLMDNHGMDVRALEALLYRHSGLLGVSGISSDMRKLRASSDPAAGEAIALFIYRIVCEVGALVAALGGIDALVFTGGIGENDARTRAGVAAGCRWLGLEIDETRDVDGEASIGAASSRVAVWVIPTDEERMMARHTRTLLGS